MGRITRSLRTLAGRRSDWHLVMPAILSPRVSTASIGPLLLVLALAGSWFAFASAGGGGSVAVGLYLGAVAIQLMAACFVLALRPRILESVFGGLDRMYRVHRWAGSLAVVAMFLHIQIEPEIDGGIRGAARSLAEGAEELAGIAELLLYGLVALSLSRWLPYRWWRWTHKLLGVPFVFACLHFFTAEKTYSNGSPWGWWFGAWMLAGTVTYLWRVVVRDVLAPGHEYVIRSAVVTANTTELRMAPSGPRPLGQRSGQFAFLRIRLPGLREPHPFTIASPPDDPELRFLVRGLGDWSRRLQGADLVGARVAVEGPYGHFHPADDTRTCLWVAGGVGITPFLATVGHLTPTASPERRPLLAYCVRSRGEAMALAELSEADRDGRIRLSLHVSDEGTRLDASRLAAMIGRVDLRGVALGVCGPSALVAAVTRAGRRLGASVHTEGFDIRQGFGPDLSLEIEALVHRPARIGAAPASSVTDV